MPVTRMRDIVGKKCDVEGCSNWATHFYGCSAICCECHAGKGNEIVPQDEMAFVNEYFGKHGDTPSYLLTLRVMRERRAAKEKGLEVTAKAQISECASASAADELQTIYSMLHDKVVADDPAASVKRLKDFLGVRMRELGIPVEDREELAVAEPDRGWVIVDFYSRELATTMIYDDLKEAQADASEIDNGIVIQIEW